MKLLERHSSAYQSWLIKSLNILDIGFGGLTGHPHYLNPKSKHGFIPAERMKKFNHANDNLLPCAVIKVKGNTYMKPAKICNF